jgi:hypothetical protein
VRVIRSGNKASFPMPRHGAMLNLGPIAMPREISSRSSSLSAAEALRRGAGTIPPWSTTIRSTPVLFFLSSAREMAAALPKPRALIRDTWCGDARHTSRQGSQALWRSQRRRQWRHINRLLTRPRILDKDSDVAARVCLSVLVLALSRRPFTFATPVLGGQATAGLPHRHGQYRERNLDRKIVRCGNI